MVSESTSSGSSEEIPVPFSQKIGSGLKQSPFAFQCDGKRSDLVPPPCKEPADLCAGLGMGRSQDEPGSSVKPLQAADAANILQRGIIPTAAGPNSAGREWA